MARQTGPRNGLKLEAQRISAKTFRQCVRSQLQRDYGLAPRLAEELTTEAVAYLSGLPNQRLPEQICLALPTGRENHRRKLGGHDTKPVLLTPCTFDPDLPVLEALGVTALQNARLIRLIREAWQQDALLTQGLLAGLCNMTAKTVSARLRHLRSLEIRLPTLGDGHEQRSRPCFDSSTQVLRALLQGRPAAGVRKQFFASSALLDRFLHQLRRVRHHAAAKTGIRELSTVVGEPAEVVSEYVDLIEAHRGKPHFELLVPDQLPAEPPDSTLPDTVRFLETLQHDYGLARAEANLLHHDLLVTFGPNAHAKRGDGQLLFYAISSDEPAGKPLAECESLPMVLDYFTDEDRQADTVTALKRNKAHRLAEQAKAQGAYLTQSDLAYLLGVSSAVISRLHASQTENNLLPFPTRGQEADMGRGVSHRAKIVKLWMQLYTETEIVRRTGHNYSSVENYLQAFGRFLLLKDRQMPLPAIRKVLGCSMVLVEAYDELYREFSTQDYWYRFEILRARVLREEGADPSSPSTESARGEKTIPFTRKEDRPWRGRPQHIGLCATGISPPNSSIT